LGVSKFKFRMPKEKKKKKPEVAKLQSPGLGDRFL
jgi:hypothetical protein